MKRTSRKTRILRERKYSFKKPDCKSIRKKGVVWRSICLLLPKISTHWKKKARRDSQLTMQKRNVGVNQSKFPWRWEDSSKSTGRNFRKLFQSDFPKYPRLRAGVTNIPRLSQISQLLNAADAQSLGLRTCTSAMTSVSCYHHCISAIYLPVCLGLWPTLEGPLCVLQARPQPTHVCLSEFYTVPAMRKASWKIIPSAF